MRYGERLEEIVEAAVARGDAPGVVAAVSQGGETYVTAAGVTAVGGPGAPFEDVMRDRILAPLGTAWTNVPDQDLTVVVLTQRAADETGMPAVCDEVLAAARSGG